MARLVGVSTDEVQAAGSDRTHFASAHHVFVFL
jgi:hypothetical protein